MMQHLAPGKVLFLNVGAHAMYYLVSCLFFTVLLLQSIQSIVVLEAQSAKDIDLTCFKTFPIKTATCLQVGPMSLELLILLPDLMFPVLRFLLVLPATNSNEAIFQLPYVPVGDTMLFKHHRKYYSVLQVGMDVALSFPKACDVLPGTPEVSLDRCFPNRRTESLNSNISRSSLTPLTSFVSRRCMERTNIFRLFRCWLRDFGFLVPLFLLMKTREDWLSAFTGTFYLKGLL